MTLQFWLSDGEARRMHTGAEAAARYAWRAGSPESHSLQCIGHA